MKKIYLLSLFGAVLMAGCSHDGGMSPEGYGTILLNADLDTDTETIDTRATPDLSGYYLVITHPGGSQETLAFPASNRLENMPAGRYTLKVQSFEQSYTPAFASPQYSGETSVTVVPRQTASAEITCKQDNAGVFFIYDETLVNAGLQDIVPTITPSSGVDALEYSGTNRDATGYFPAGQARITFTVGGQEWTIADEDKTLLDLAREQLWRVTLSVTADGKGGISLEIKVEEITEPTDELEINIGSGGGKAMVESNTYMVKPGGSVSIPVSRAYKVWRQEFGTELTGTSTVELLWTDNSNGMKAAGAVESIELKDADKGEQAYIAVKAGASAGNALIALKIEGTVRWSWLVWVTDYDPDNGGTTYYHKDELISRGYTFMDRNVGALREYGEPDSHGFLFQWGRKDPFPGAGLIDNEDNALPRYLYSADGTILEVSDMWSEPKSGINFTDVVPADNLSNAITKPMDFYLTAWFENWWGTAMEMTPLWKSSGGVKSVYDPCPPGWRVPHGQYEEVFGDYVYCYPWNFVNYKKSDGPDYVFFEQFGYIPLYGDLDAGYGRYEGVGYMSSLWTADYEETMSLPYITWFNTPGTTQGSLHCVPSTWWTTSAGFAVRCEKE